MTRLTVIVPAYNEERVIGDTVDQVAAYLHRLGGGGELIVVDDGSHDRTPDIVRERAEWHGNVQLISDGRNLGKGGAVARGVMASTGDYLVYTDADLVYPIDGADHFMRVIDNGADVATASRSHARTLFALHPRHFPYIYQRYLVGRAYIAVVNRMLQLSVTDTQAGFKCFRGDVARDIFRRGTLTNFAFDVEILFIARLLGYRIVEAPVYFLYLGEQSSVELARDTVRMLLSLWQIRANARRGVYGTRHATIRRAAKPEPRTELFCPQLALAASAGSFPRESHPVLEPMLEPHGSSAATPQRSSGQVRRVAGG
jgi:dolichyl-phosphate beta-glucosyltransferase